MNIRHDSTKLGVASKLVSSLQRCTTILMMMMLLLMWLFPFPISGEGENLHLYRRPTDYTFPKYERGGAGYVDSDVSRGNNRRRPYFRSHGQTYRIKIGDPVTMTCVVENLGKWYGFLIVVIWFSARYILTFLSSVLKPVFCLCSSHAVYRK